LYYAIDAAANTLRRYDAEMSDRAIIILFIAITPLNHIRLPEFTFDMSLLLHYGQKSVDADGEIIHMSLIRPLSHCCHMPSTRLSHCFAAYIEHMPHTPTSFTPIDTPRCKIR